MHFLPDQVFDYVRKAWQESPKKREMPLKTAILTKESKIFIKAKLTISKSCHLGLLGFYDFLHFKGRSYLNHKISFNLSVKVAIFLVFHNLFMILFHILMSVLEHKFMLDDFLITSSVLSNKALNWGKSISKVHFLENQGILLQIWVFSSWPSYHKC